MNRAVAGILLWLLGAAVFPSPGCAGDVLVATAANFYATARDIGARFNRESGHRVDFAVGSTGKLYAQIIQGAPFDLLLAADQARPQRLLASGDAVAGSQFTYASGRLLLWSPRPGLEDEDPKRLLRDPQLRRLAIANPALAPYGRAARQVLEAMQLWDQLRGRIVFGENVAQAFAMAASGNAEFSLVAASQVPEGRGSRWTLPPSLYDPIRQDAVLLRHGADKPAARDFLHFLRTAAIRDRVRAAGYTVD